MDSVSLSKFDMNKIDFLQINKLSDLHNDYDIHFCKTDYIFKDFDTISKLNHPVIFITGNSDYAITDAIMDNCPENIETWYAQNALANHSKLIPIPIGIENKIEAKRIGHGIAYQERVNKKERILNNLPNVIPNKFIYANFNTATNYSYRSHIKNLCINQKHIDWQDPNLSLQEMFNIYLNYKMILCPIGNGIDTHRIWEVLYCNRIPVTIKVGNYKIYDLYKNFPIIVLNSPDELTNVNFLKQQYKEILNKNYNNNMLDIQYWNNKILKGSSK